MTLNRVILRFFLEFYSEPKYKSGIVLLLPSGDFLISLIQIRL